MAITPEECVKITDTEVEQVARIEKYLDAQLKILFTRIDLSITIDVNETLSERVWGKLVRNYEAVGWEVYFEVVKNSVVPSKPFSKFRFLKQLITNPAHLNSNRFFERKNVEVLH